MMCAAALGGQTQKEATNKSTGQDNVPLYKVCGLRRNREEIKRIGVNRVSSVRYPTFAVLFIKE